MSDANTATATIPANSSNFTYEPPASEASPQELTEFNNLLDGSISDISKEYNPGPEFTDEELRGGEDSGQEQQAKPEVQDTAGQGESAKESPEVARGLERLVQRELEVQAKEQGFAQREARVQSLEAENKQLRGAVPTKDLLAKFDVSPSDALKAMGKDPATVVRLMIAEQLAARGEPVPEGLQKFVEKAASERRISELEAQIKSRDEATRQAQVFSAVQTGAREYAKTLDGKKLPSLAAAKSDPELVHELIMEEIDRLAAKDPNAALTYDVAAGSAEKRLARIAKALGPQVTNPQASTQTPKTQANAGTQQNPQQTPPAVKAPTKPLKPWEQRDTDLNAAIKEAEREYHISEARRVAQKR